YFWRQFVWHIYRKPLSASVAGHSVTAVAFAGGARGAILANARALPQRNGPYRNRPEPLHGVYKPSFDFFGLLLSFHVQALYNTHS
ncbi:MAG TPA: hypothetical protein VI685_05705, partial [Candidatus Angelobacter sp.]